MAEIYLTLRKRFDKKSIGIFFVSLFNFLTSLIVAKKVLQIDLINTKQKSIQIVQLSKRKY